MSPVLGLPGPQPGPQNRTLNLFFHPSISLNLSIMYLRYPNYQVRVAKNIYWYTCILLAAIICQMEQVSQHLQSNFQGSWVNLSLIKLWLFEYITGKNIDTYYRYGLSFWIYKPEWHWVQMCWLGVSAHTQLPPPLLERSLSKLINDANMDKIYKLICSLI